MSYFGATGILVLDFWSYLLWVSKPEGSSLFACFPEANVMYIPQDPPLVLSIGSRMVGGGKKHEIYGAADWGHLFYD